MLHAELKILGGKHQGKAIPLSTKKFLVGREQDCQLRPNSDLVSRHHCVFTIDDYAVRLRDLGSTNGTRVNGKPLHGEVSLKNGDQVGIGKLELELVVRQYSAAVVPAATDLGSSEFNVVPGAATIEIPSVIADSNPVLPSGGETSYELPTLPMPLMDQTSTTLAGDTAIVGNSAPVGYPGYPQAYPGMPMPGYPAPQNYPQQPMGYPMQQMGYPQYPQGYAPPGYPQPGYPGMPGYPAQMPYGAGYPGAVQAPVETQPEAPAEVGVRLPPPESTGVKVVAPPPAVAAPAGGAKTEEKPSNTAADIIKQYMQKRTR